MCFLLIPAFGVIGAAVANLAGTVVINLMRAVEVWAIMHTHAYDSGYFKPVMAGTAAALITGLADRFVAVSTGPGNFMLLASVLLLIFIGAIFALGIDKQDRTVMLLLRGRLVRNGTA